jgi:hypothetical protein
MSEQKSLASALAKANAEIANPKFDKVNPHFKSKFASHAAVRDAVAPVYAKHGLSIIQDLRTVERGIECYTTILHESGEERTYGPLLIVATKFDGQGVAAAGTYAKRIQLQAVANVVGDEDDDGESTVGRVNPSEDIKPQEFTNPQGDKWTAKDTKKANEYALRLQDAQMKGHSLLELWDEAKSAGETFALAVWRGLPKSIKDEIKDQDDQRKKEAA